MKEARNYRASSLCVRVPLLTAGAQLAVKRRDVAARLVAVAKALEVPVLRKVVDVHVVGLGGGELSHGNHPSG